MRATYTWSCRFPPSINFLSAEQLLCNFHGHSCLSPTMSHHGSQEPSVRNSIAGILSRELPRVLLQSNMASPMTANARLASGPTTSELFASSRRMVSVVIGGCFCFGHATFLPDSNSINIAVFVLSSAKSLSLVRALFSASVLRAEPNPCRVRRQPHQRPCCRKGPSSRSACSVGSGHRPS